MLHQESPNATTKQKSNNKYSIGYQHPISRSCLYRCSIWEMLLFALHFVFCSVVLPFH